MLRLTNTLGRTGARGVTSLAHLVDLDVGKAHSRERKTKIICTIGPASDSPSTIRLLLEAGMNVMRLNCSHGSHEHKAEVIAELRSAISELREDGMTPDFSDGSNEEMCAIALDTKGPEVRTGPLPPGVDGIPIATHATVTLSTKEDTVCSADKIFLDYPTFADEIGPGQVVFVDDGLIELVVVDTNPEEGSVETRVVAGGILGGHKGVNLPNADLELPAVTDIDRADLAFAAQQGVDMVFASFIRSAEDVAEVRAALGEDGKDIQVISKIENMRGVENFDEILAVSDGIMVARGDLGIEVPASKVFLAQKMIIAKCELAAKPVITATQMLESMVSAPRPTRAEVSDVGNAVVDGTDAVMLSGETAKGEFPLEAVKIMGKICQEAETVIDYTTLARDIALHHAAFEERLVECSNGAHNVSAASDAISAAASLASSSVKASAIVVLSESGHTARDVARFRVPVPIIAVTQSDTVARQLNLSRGIFPVLSSTSEMGRMREIGVEFGKVLGLLEDGDGVVVVDAPLGDVAVSIHTV